MTRFRLVHFLAIAMAVSAAPMSELEDLMYICDDDTEFDAWFLSMKIDGFVDILCWDGVKTPIFLPISEPSGQEVQEVSIPQEPAASRFSMADVPGLIRLAELGPDGAVRVPVNPKVLQSETSVPEAPAVTHPPVPEVNKPAAPSPPPAPEVPAAPSPPAVPEASAEFNPPPAPEAPVEPSPPPVPEVPAEPSPPSAPEVSAAPSPPPTPEVIIPSVPEAAPATPALPETANTNFAPTDDVSLRKPKYGHQNNHHGANLPKPTNYCSTVEYHFNLHRLNHSAPPVKYSHERAAYAAERIDDCRVNPVENYGSNFFGTWGMAPYSDSDKTTRMSHTLAAIEAWYDGEHADYGRATQDYTAAPNQGTFHAWGHFSQLLWQDEEYIGCYTKRCGKDTPATNFGGTKWDYAWYTICSSTPMGNYMGKYTQNVKAPLGHPPSDYSIMAEGSC